MQPTTGSIGRVMSLSYAAENLQLLALWCTTLDETVSLLRTRSEKEGDVERVVKDSDVC